ncbi:MAG: chorismate synthase [Bacteroidetes bacterium]|nr:MAG: chorismate synthase [Bacteroidota bacterium]
MNTLGKHIRLTSYGESHGAVIGAVLDGFPAGFKLDKSFIQNQLGRRKPGQSDIVTPRRESDEVIVNSGVFEGFTTGAPIHFQIQNNNAQPKDYSHLKEVYRPSHADYTYEVRYGHRDYRGGGRSSARITAGWVAGGALVQDYLAQKKGIEISAYVKQIQKVKLDTPARFYSIEEVDTNIVRCPNNEIAEQMITVIKQAQDNQDSLGGIIECVITGVPAGLGNPVFDKLNATLGHAMLSINAVKGFELGGGFEMTHKRGSEVNDAFEMKDGKPYTKTNFSGGIQGGISNGMDIVFRVAFKPTATIGSTQATINRDGESVSLKATGRHDPCVVPRAVPIVETLAALVLGDFTI